MDIDELDSRLKRAKAEMENAQEEMLKDALCNEKFRRFIETKQIYWKMADEWLVLEGEKFQTAGEAATEK